MIFRGAKSKPQKTDPRWFSKILKATNWSIQARSATPGGQIEHRCTKVDACSTSPYFFLAWTRCINFCAPVLDLTAGCSRSRLDWPIGVFDTVFVSPNYNIMEFHWNKKISPPPLKKTLKNKKIWKSLKLIYRVNQGPKFILSNFQKNRPNRFSRLLFRKFDRKNIPTENVKLASVLSQKLGMRCTWEMIVSLQTGSKRALQEIWVLFMIGISRMWLSCDHREVSYLGIQHVKLASVLSQKLYHRPTSEMVVSLQTGFKRALQEFWAKSVFGISRTMSIVTYRYWRV